MPAIPDDCHDSSPLTALADAVTRAWERHLELPRVDPQCSMCSDTSYLPAPLEAWQPACPRPSCASRRHRTDQAHDTDQGFS